ncbi:MAG TPA: hypothetical protein VGG57_22950 [Stellaceae bacterium]|jgi:hypothetical protein
MLESISPLATGILFVLAMGPACAENLRFRCTNATSGAAWDISVDVDHRRVDNLPAEMNAASISWRDAKNRIYELDRATGALRMRNASSTGGYYLYYTCKPG